MVQRPRLAPSGHAEVVAVCPFLGVELTCGICVVMSGFDPISTVQRLR
jgi:hypothetical protein